MNRGHPRLRPDLQFDRNAGIEEHAVENPRHRFGRRLQSIAMGAIGAGKYQRKPGGAVLEIVQRLRVGLRGIGMIDPLHDLPGRGRRAAWNRSDALRAPVDRLDPQPVGGLADQLFERRALQHAIDQLAPVVVACRREIRSQS